MRDRLVQQVAALLPESVLHVARLIHLRELATSMVYGVGVLAVMYGVIYLLEGRLGEDRSRYRSRNFVNDVTYLLFYQGGFYNVLIGAALANALGSRLAFFKLNVLGVLPAPVHWLLYWVALDFLDYWFHRLRHHVPWLWAFHTIHHSQEQLTCVTSFRQHPVEQILGNIVLFIPLLVLGIPTGVWFPLVMALNAFEAVQHSRLNWRYGPLYRVVVSPVFHNFHHSLDPKHRDVNFGKLLSVWDFMFGTAVESDPRPVETGVIGLRVPASVLQQLITPFRLLLARSRPRRQTVDVDGGRTAASPASAPQVTQKL